MKKYYIIQLIALISSMPLLCNNECLGQLFNAFCVAAVSCDSLDFSKKSVTTLDPYPCYCGDSYRVKHLILRDNLLENLPAQTFARFPNLQTIDLENNYISTYAPLAFANIDFVTFLNIRFNKLTHLQKYMFSPFNNTVIFTKTNTETGEQIITVTSTLMMRTLLLDHNEIITVEEETFRNLWTLEELNLSYNQISMLQNKTFKDLNTLLALIINHNKISSIAPQTFDPMPKLTYLDLSNNQLTDDSGITTQSFISLPNLKTVDLRMNFFTPAYQQELINAYPTITFKF